MTRLSSLKSVKRSIQLSLLLIALIQLSSCAMFDRIPGGANIYCVSSKWSEEFNNTVKEARYDYQRFKHKRIGSNGGICAFNTFTKMRIYWTTKTGVVREENLDLRVLMDKMIKEQRPDGGFPASGRPNVHGGRMNGTTRIYIKIVGAHIELYYRIHHSSVITVKNEEGKRVRKMFNKEYIYTLYTSNKNGH